MTMSTSVTPAINLAAGRNLQHLDRLGAVAGDHDPAEAEVAQQLLEDVADIVVVFHKKYAQAFEVINRQLGLSTLIQAVIQEC